jgi:hypothetical protein
MRPAVIASTEPKRKPAIVASAAHPAGDLLRIGPGPKGDQSEVHGPVARGEVERPREIGHGTQDGRIGAEAARKAEQTDHLDPPVPQFPAGEPGPLVPAEVGVRAVVHEEPIGLAQARPGRLDLAADRVAERVPVWVEAEHRGA